MLDLAKENQNKAIALQEQFLLRSFNEINGATNTEALAESEPITTSTDSISTNIEVETVAQNVITTDSISQTAVETETIVAENTMATDTTTATISSAEKSTITPEEALALINEETPAAAQPEAVVEQIETDNKESTSIVSDVFLTIQIMADKQKVSENDLKNAYNGSLELIEKEGNGWYRYSVGRFADKESAQKIMEEEGLKGYIVAYNKTQRISVQEAIEILTQK